MIRQGSYKGKLTERDTRNIRFLSAKGVSQKEIAERYKVSESCIDDTVKRRLRNHIQ